MNYMINWCNLRCATPLDVTHPLLKDDTHECFICYEVTTRTEDPDFSLISLQSLGEYTKRCKCIGTLHSECLRKWMDVKPCCPVCRGPLTKRLTKYKQSIQMLNSTMVTTYMEIATEMTQRRIWWRRWIIQPFISIFHFVKRWLLFIALIHFYMWLIKWLIEWNVSVMLNKHGQSVMNK